jgi:CDP-diacylglycerol--serine O-phosphatidyltransferase
VLRTIQVLPTLITAGNLVAGLLAISYLVDAAGADAARAEALAVKAAWLIFLGMFFDALDGRIARMTGTTSDFGAQLDSLADTVTFGVAPALLVKSILTPAFPLLSGKLVFGICLVYVLGAALRLARYNVESERTKESGIRHVTRIFRGLPSPAAAGVLASLVLLGHEYQVHAWLTETLHWVMLVGPPLLGLFMISRMPYTHLLNRYFDAQRAHPVIVVLLLVLVYLVVQHFVETVTTVFVLYALSGPLLTASHRLVGRPRWAEHEEEDEEEIVQEDEADEEPGEPQQGMA